MYASIMILLGQVEDRRAIAGREDAYMYIVIIATNKYIALCDYTVYLPSTLAPGN